MRLAERSRPCYETPVMKSCLGLLLAMLILIAVIATGAGLWYLSSTAEFSRKDAPAAAQKTR